MKDYRKHIKNVNYLATILFVFWLPLKDNYFPVIISFWIFTWLLEGNFKTRFTTFPHKGLYIGILLYFILIVSSLFYTNDIDHGLFHIQEKLSIAFFPIILLGSNEKVKQNYHTLLIVFVIANLIASIYSLTNALIANIVVENGTWFVKHWIWPEMQNESFWKLINIRASVFSYSHLSIFKHPAYFAMYLTFSISILVYLYKQKIAKKSWQKILIIGTMVFFAFMIYLLQSSAGFITFGVVSILSVLYEFKAKQKKRYIFVGSIFIIMGILALSFSKPAQKRLKDYTYVILNPKTSKLFEKDDRIGLWYSAVEVIKENFWLGTAPADLSDELAKKYEKYNLEDAQEEKLNAHNQYLETFAGIGIFGFLSLIFILAYGFYHAYKKRNYLLLFLLVILTINFLFESMMNRMTGILFMMFFYSLFIFMDNKPNKVSRLISDSKKNNYA
ncbi:MAG: hypothetical protein DRJ10_04100 [Bacteroidetes bacterium]|nr:MAG: hypothetical protein DRJ10_04100 [Bacteroidota bacterium]